MEEEYATFVGLQQCLEIRQTLSPTRRVRDNPRGKDDKNMHQMLDKKPGLLFTKSYFQSELVSPVQFITDCSVGLPKTFVPT